MSGFSTDFRKYLYKKDSGLIKRIAVNVYKK